MLTFLAYIIMFKSKILRDVRPMNMFSRFQNEGLNTQLD